MLCPHCGTNLADDAKFCGSCGNQLPQAAAQPQPQTPAEAQPVQPAVAVAQPPVYTPPVPTAVNVGGNGQPEGKSKFIANHGTPGVKTASWVSWIACILCAVMLIASGIYTATCPLVDLPIFNFMADMDETFERDLEELEDTLDETELYMEEFREIYEAEEDMYTDEQQDAVEAFLKLEDKFNSKLSIRTLVRAVGMMEDIVEADLADEYGVGDMEEIQEVQQIFRTITIAAVISAAFTTLLLLLAARFKLNTLTILTMLFTLPSIFVLGGTLMMLLTFALYVAAIVSHIIINSNYHKYRKAMRVGM